MGVRVCAAALAVWLAAGAGALAQAGEPPAPVGGTLQLRLVLNEDTKPLAIAAVSDPETRLKVQQIADYVLGQVGEILVWRYAIPEAADAATTVGAYRTWAADRDLRPFGMYRVRHDPEPGKEPAPDGLAELHYASGEAGGLFGAMADAGMLTLVWAEGDIALGPLVAAWLGLPELTEEASDTAVPEADAQLPALPDGLPMDRLDLRLDLTARELRPLARDLEARAELPADVDPDMLVLIRKGVGALEPVRGLTILVFRTEAEAEVLAVTDPAKAWAAAKGWGSVFVYGEGEKAAELFAKFGDAGGAMVVGRRGENTAILVTEGCPDLMALVAG